MPGHAQKKNVDTPEKVLDMWLGAVGTSAEHLRQASLWGYAIKKKPVLSDAQIEAGYELIEVPNSLKYDELIVKMVMPQIGDKSVVEDLAKLSFAEMRDMLLEDLGTIDDDKKLKMYLLYGTEYSNTDPEEPEVKKNLNPSV